MVAATLDLGQCVDDAEAYDTVKSWSEGMVEDIESMFPNLDHGRVRLLINEFTRNALHGDCPRVNLIPLPDGSVLFECTDQLGKDHLNPDFCSHKGDLIIHQLAGAENYRKVQKGTEYRSYLHISPHSTI